MDHILNNYRHRKIDAHHFVTTDHGSHILLSNQEFLKLRRGDIDSGLRMKLEEREIILCDQNISEVLRLLGRRHSFLSRGTSLHIIVPTLRCNMRCVYCHASSKPDSERGFDMDESTATKTVDFVFQSPNDHIAIEFQGGEPLLNWPIVKHIIAHAEKSNVSSCKDLSFTLVTNLSLMDEETMSYLIDHNVNVCTSLDGPKEIHDLNRPYTGASNFDIVVGWIKRFQDEYARRGLTQKRVHALTTITKRSLAYPEQIVDTYANLGLNSIHLRFLNNLGMAQKTWSLIGYTAEEYLDFWKKALARTAHHRKTGTVITERMAEIITIKIAQETDPGYLDLRSPCGAAIGQLAYDHNGDIYTCDEGRMVGDDMFLLGNVKNDRYNDIVTCEKACAVVTASINDQYICDTCAYKPYCGVCPVCAYADEGSVIGCVSRSDRCKILKTQFDTIVRERFIKQETK